MATKKGKVDTECRVFNEKWGEKYFFVEADNHTAIV